MELDAAIDAPRADGMIDSLNRAISALPRIFVPLFALMFFALLAQIVHQEYDHEFKPQNVMARIRRGVARFGSVVIVALVPESLILVIKYSQKDLAGFLFYPAAIIVSTAFLLIALGLFARLTATPMRATRPRAGFIRTPAVA